MEFEQILDEYKNLMWHIINSFVSKSNIPHSHTDDIFQEASVRIYEKYQTYNPAMSSMKTFVASNTEIVCMRYRREYFKTAHFELDENDFSANIPFSATTSLIDDYGTNQFNRKIIYRKLHGYTQQEIADEYNTSQSTVSRILSDFRDYLTEIMN